MKRIAIAGLLLVAMVSALWAQPAFAASGSGRYGAPPPERERGGGISLSGGVVPIGSGKAGDESFPFGWINAPNYDDVYDAGWLLRAEPYVDFNRFVRGQIGIAHDEWSGKSFNDGLGAVKFGDLKMTAFYAGVRVRFLPGRWIRPYAVADIGLAHFDAVDVTGFHGPGVKSRYWDSTNTLYFDIGGGAEFRVAPHVSFFVDVRVQATGSPDSADPPASDADGVGSVPVTAGVNFSF